MILRRAVITLILATFLLAIVGSLSAGKSSGSGLIQLAGQTVDIEDPALTPAEQKCDNWGWVAGIQSALTPQDVHFSQRDWILKLYSGEACVNDLPSLENMVRWIEGDYSLDDGRKVHLQPSLQKGAPTDMGALIAPLRDKRPLVMLWKKHTYILVGMVYDEYIYPNNQRMFEARELKLLDTYDGKSATFTKGMDDPSEILGVLDVTVGPIDHFRQSTTP